MAILYPWARPDYLLWKMSIEQIILFYNLGLEMKYGKGEREETPSLRNMTPEELTKLREQLRKDYGD
jgi:hypothetical protein